MKGYPIILFVLVSICFVTFIILNANRFYSYYYAPCLSITLVTVVLILSLFYSVFLYVKEKANDYEDEKEKDSKES